MSASVIPRTEQKRRRSRGLGRWVLILTALGLGALMATNIPDAVRYWRMTQL